MAQQPRNNATTFSSSDEQLLPTRPQVKYTVAPLFTSRGQPREAFSWAANNSERRHRRAVQAEFKAEKDRAALSAESSPIEESVSELPRPSNARIINRLDNGFSLDERLIGGGASQQIAGETGGQRPRSAGLHDIPSRRRRHLQRGSGSDSSLPGSRIPEIKNVSPVQTMQSNAAATTTNAYQRAEWETVNRDLPDPSSEDETAESMLGSPSPAAKARKEAKYRVMGLPDYSNEEIEKMKNWRQRTKEGAETYRKSKANKPPVVEDPNDPYVIRRAKLAESEALLARMAARTTPLFVKGTTSNRVMETARELERKTSSSHANEVQSAASASKQSASSLRQRPAWVERILNSDSSVEIPNLPLDHTNEILNFVADTPLPSIEAPANPTRSFVRPASAQTYHMSPEKNKLWDGDLDFTGNSIQISNSPQLRVRQLDNVRDEEITNLVARAVATSRLEEIRERNSEERSVPPETPPSNFGKTVPEPSRREQPGEQSEEPYLERTILDDEGVHIPGTPFTVFDAKTYRPISQNQVDERYGHKREDSYELLRTLSRSISRSPPSQFRADPMEEDERVKSVEGNASVTGTNPAPETISTSADNEGNGKGEKNFEDNATEKSVEKAPEEVTKSNEISLEVHQESNGQSRSSSHPRSEIDPEERITAEAKLFELQDNKSERNSIRAPSSPASDDEKFDEKFDETPKPKMQDPMMLPTPKVMGAFIETPAPTIRRPRDSRTITPYYEVGDEGTVSAFASINKETMNDSQKQKPRLEPSRASSASSIQQESIRPHQRMSRSRPPLVNSAKPVSALEDLRRLKLEAQIDDSTLEDFNGFVGAPLGITASSELKSDDLEPLLDLEFDEKGRPLSGSERERRLQQLALRRMNQHLKNTSSSIRDARHGIERLEQQVSNSFAVPVALKAADETIYVKLPLPRLWIKDPQGAKQGGKHKFYSRKWKFTWLGLILLGLMTWVFAESAVCEVYCHPKYSSKNTWKPSDPFFPWAIPTKLDQWTGEYASTGAYNALEYIDGLFGPKIGRRRWWSPGPTRTASDWWMGRDGPRGIRESTTEGLHSIFGDEVI